MWKIKKFLAIFLLGMQALFLILILLYLSLGSDNVRSATVFGSEDVSYVLVNEDLGAVFNGTEYNLGSDFVTLISQDVQNRWQIASRSMAEAGFRSGTFDVIIILPQNFSERLLSLQSLTPEQAQIIYEVRMGYNELANMAVREQVAEILGNFNQRVIRMYFSSILGNLFDAQLNVGEMVSDEQYLFAIFLDAIRTPFYELPNYFTEVINDTLLIESETDFWLAQYDDFSEEVQQILADAAERLEGQLPLLEDYVYFLQFLGEMNQLNAQFSVDQQAEIAQEFYRKQFSSFGNMISSWLNQFYSEDYAQRTILGEFSQTANNFHDDQVRLIADLHQKIELLERQIDDLLIARQLVAEIYFATGDLSLNNVTEADTRQAIFNLIRLGNNRTPLAQAYFTTLENYIERIAVTDLRAMITHLKEDAGLIDINQYRLYMEQLGLIERYAKEERLNEENVNFTFINVDDFPDYRAFSHKVTFEIFPNEEKIIIRFMSEYENIVIGDIEIVRIDIENQINAHLSNMGYELVASVALYDDYHHFIIRFDPVLAEEDRAIIFEESDIYGIEVPINVGEDEADNVILKPRSCPICPDLASNMTPFTITVDMDLIWKFCPTEKARQFGQQDFAWINCAGELPCELDNEDDNTIFSSQLAYLSTLYNLHSALTGDLGIIIEQFNLLGSASRQIVTLFGTPTENGQRLDYFIARLEPHEEAGTIIDQAHPESIYNRYGNLTISEQENLIIDSIFYSFQRDGQRLYANLAAGYEQLVVVTIANRLILTAMVDPDSFFDEVDMMLAWYLEVVANVADSFHDWTESEIVEVMLMHHFGLPDLDLNSTTIYFDYRYGDSILATIGLILSLMKGDSELILSHALELATFDDQFAEVVDQTEVIQSLVEGIISDISLFSERTDESILDNHLFSERFSQVMANARIGGVDNRDVLDFLSSPISLTGSYERLGEVSFVPYYLTIISVVLSFAVGYGLRYFWKQRTCTIADVMVNRGLIWKNAPFVLKLGLVSFGVGFIFSVISARVAEQSSIIMWMMYVPILVAIGILVMSYLARQIPKASLFIVGALFAAYLFLNPVLGVQLEPETNVAWLFSVSPLQYVEHLYANIIAGEFLSILGYIVLIGVVVVCVLLNLLVYDVNSNDV